MNDDDRRSPLTPALALRVAIVGSVVLALFAIVFFRLWFLQVLTGSQYVRAAAVNRTRDVAIAMGWALDAAAYLHDLFVMDGFGFLLAEADDTGGHVGDE